MTKDEFSKRHAQWLAQWKAAAALAAEKQCSADDPRVLAITEPVFREVLDVMTAMTSAQRAEVFAAHFTNAPELATQLYVIGLGFL